MLPGPRRAGPSAGSAASCESGAAWDRACLLTLLQECFCGITQKGLKGPGAWILFGTLGPIWVIDLDS